MLIFNTVQYAQSRVYFHPMIAREFMPFIKKAAQQYPVITVTGPRHSGKTTLCKTSLLLKLGHVRQAFATDFAINGVLIVIRPAT